jgi:hypothetical protein
LGFGVAEVLSVVLAAPAVVALVKSLQAWITQRRPKVRVELKVGKVTVVLDAENMPKPELLLEYVAPLLQAAADDAK